VLPLLFPLCARAAVEWLAVDPRNEIVKINSVIGQYE
jgi:hypothetical protein